MSTQTNRNLLSNERNSHVVACHFCTGVRILLTLSLIATIVTLLFSREVAYLAAIPIPFLYAILSLANYLVVRSRTQELRAKDGSRLSDESVDERLQIAGTLLVLKIMGVLAVATFVSADAFWHPHHLRKPPQDFLTRWF